MNNTKDLLFALLRNSLWLSEEALPEMLPDNMMKQLFILAEEQTVSGMVVDALIRNDVRMPQQWVFEMLGLEAQNRLANQNLNDELKQLANLQLKNYVIVKGQTIAAIYRNPLLRMPGDIDFFVQKYDEAKDVLQREWNIELPSKLADRECAFEHGGATYEIHDNLIIFGSRKHQKSWEQLMKRPCGFADVDGMKVPTLVPTVNAIYVFIHLFFHFLREGVSLRQFCDWAIILHHYRDEIDRNDLIDVLKKLDLQKAYRAFGTILVDNLGLSDIEFPFELNNEDREWKNMILDDIFKGGSFGKLLHQTDCSWKYKMETMRIAFRNTLRYYVLCPSEVGLMIPRLMKQNLKILVS